MLCGDKSEPIVLGLTRCREAAEAAGDDLLVYFIDMAILRAKETRVGDAADSPGEEGKIVALGAQTWL